ncbi:restriction endonuclease [Acinetobacter baumannii]
MNAVTPTDIGKRWQTYEEVARYVLQQIRDKLGLDEVQGKQGVSGRSGTVWELDGKGVSSSSGKSVVVECRRYKNRLKQDAVAAVAYKITDTSSDSGIIVSPLPLQKGGRIIAEAEGIQHVELTPDSTTEDWLAKIGEVLHVGVTIRESTVMGESYSAEVRDQHGNFIERISGAEDL